jgi:hypothetical protein
MKFTKLAVLANVWDKVRMPAILVLVALLASACSNINIEAAKALSSTGRDTASRIQQNVLASEKEYLRGRDCIALCNGFDDTTKTKKYQEILEGYDKNQKEIRSRSVVFERLAELYTAFGELAGLDAGVQTEKALKDLGEAINGYAKATDQSWSVPSDATVVISKIGGLLTEEIQKAKIKEASKQIRDKVEDFIELLKYESTGEHLLAYRKDLFSERKHAFKILWSKGVYDPKPIFDDFGEDAGLTAQGEAVKKINPDSELGKAIAEVIDKRLELKSNTIQEDYDASLAAIKQLIKEHNKLEKGEPLDLAHLRAITAKL